MIYLGAIKNLSYVKKYPRGTIISEDDNSTEMYVVLKGEVGIVVNGQKQNNKVVSTVGPGEFFGETALFLGKSPHYTAIALNDVIALPIDKNHAADFIRDEPEMAFELLKEMCVRLDQLNDACEKQNGHPWTQPESNPAKTPAAGTASNKKTASAAPASAPPEPQMPVTTPPPALQTPVTAPSEPQAPAPAAQDHPHGDGFSLFPEGHGIYQLPVNKGDQEYLMDKNCICPLCKHDFKTRKVIPSKLMMDRTDRDMRNHYKGIEPLYYDIITCPECLYSADTKMFDKPDRPAGGLSRELLSLKSETGTAFCVARDTFSVFAGYYLALLCAPNCFVNHHLETAKLLLKLSRVYQDCGDGQMEEKTVRQALDAYMYVYENVTIEANQEQQLCIIMGELNMKLNNLKDARNFFYKAKTDPNGTPLLKRQADNRIGDIREMEQTTNKKI